MITEENATEQDKNDIYHNVDKLIKISVWAKNLSWVILVISGARAVWLFIGEVIRTMTFEQTLPPPQPMGFVVLVSTLSSVLYGLLIGLFYFVVLQAVSEGIYLLMDIQKIEISEE